MSAKRLEFSARAIANMEAIKAHISSDNMAAANRVIAGILSTAGELADFPMMGHPGEIAGIRELSLSKYPYTLIYRLTAEKVLIAAVVHQSMTHRS